MRLRAKILLPGVLGLIVLAGLWASLYWILHQQQASLSRAREDVVATALLANRLGELNESMRGNLLSYYFDRKSSRLDTVADAEREIGQLLAVDRFGAESGSVRLIEQYESYEKDSAQSRLEFIRHAQSADPIALRRAFEKLAIHSNRSEAVLQDLSSNSINRLDAALGTAAQDQIALLRLGLVWVAVALLVNLLTSVYLQRRVGRRLERLAAEVERIDPARDMAMDLRADDSADEIGALARSFQAMASRLSRAYQEIRGEVAERARAEARLAGVIESAMDGIIAINAQREIVLANPAAERTFGYRAAELLGKPIEMLMPEEYRAVHAKHVQAFGRTGVTSRAMGGLGRVAGLRASGDEFPIEASISQMGPPEDRVYTVIVRDVSLRAAAEAEMNKLNSELRQRLAERDHAVGELEAFSYSVAHDLRAPLRAIDGFSRMALEEHGASVSPELKRYLEVFSVNAKRMGQLLDDLLRLSRLGRQALSIRPIDATAQVRDCLASFEIERAGRQVEVVLGELPPYEADAGLMRQVWLNLIGNAFKYTGKTAQARIEIGSIAGDCGPGYYVRDNGAGFDMRYADKLFVVFQRLHGPVEFTGTGVGLAIVARIVQRHGGRVWAEGKPGAGATFYFTLSGGESNA